VTENFILRKRQGQEFVFNVAPWCSGQGVGLVFERSRIQLPAGTDRLGHLSLQSLRVGI